MTPKPNFDTLAERIRERLSEARDDYGLGQCAACDVVLTQTDIDADECSNCHASLTDLEEEFEWLNANGLLDFDDALGESK